MSDDELGPEYLLRFATGRSAIDDAHEAVFGAIEQLEEFHEDGAAPVAEVLDAAADDAALTDCLFSIRQMLQRGEVYRPRSGTLRTIGQKEPVDASAPEIVCLCGSTAFEEAFQQAQMELSLEGKIVLTVGGFCKDDHDDEWEGIDEADKERLDELHFKKIDLADRVHVLNVDGYVGESTLNEIEHAMRERTPVTWLDPENVPDQAIEQARVYEQVSESIPDGAIDRPDLSEMTFVELREEWQATDFRYLDPRSRPLLWERAHDLWDELVERTDVEQPECPECGARNWGGGTDQPFHCRECKTNVHEDTVDDPAEFEGRIQAAHSEIGGFGGESA